MNRNIHFFGFFGNIGVTNIPQSDLEKIMRRVNIAPQKYGFSKTFQIENFFQVKAGEDAYKPYREFIQFFNKLTGLTPNEQVKDSLIPKLLDGSDKNKHLKVMNNLIDNFYVFYFFNTILITMKYKQRYYL